MTTKLEKISNKVVKETITETKTNEIVNAVDVDGLRRSLPLWEAQELEIKAKIKRAKDIIKVADDPI